MSWLVIQALLSAALGLVFATSSVPKLLEPRSFMLAVFEYQVLSPSLSRISARIIPPLELSAGLLALSGTALRVSTTMMSLMLVGFIGAIAVNIRRGRTLDCHCFGKWFPRPVGWIALALDIIVLVAALVLMVTRSAWLRPEPWSIFRLLPGDNLAATSALPICVTLIVASATALAALGKREQNSHWSGRTQHSARGLSPRRSGGTE
jgi:hypothetical protein